jgi:hypothetical protein
MLKVFVSNNYSNIFFQGNLIIPYIVAFVIACDKKPLDTLPKESVRC